MVNKYEANCHVCNAVVPPNGGNMVKTRKGWEVTHLACANGTPSVIEIRTSSGAVLTRNKNGRCEDAPCCGCCTC